MSKRSDHTRDEIREMAIDAAQASILEHGIQGVNARLIARQIGYAVGTIYQLFNSMDELIIAVNFRTLKELENQVSQAVKATAPGGCSIASAAYSYVDFSLAHTKRWLAVFEHHMPEGKDVPLTYLQQRSRLFNILEQQFSLNYPELPANQIALEARALWAGVHGICILGLSGKLDDDGLPLKSIAEVLINHFLKHQGALS